MAHREEAPALAAVGRGRPARLAERLPVRVRPGVEERADALRLAAEDSLVERRGAREVLQVDVRPGRGEEPHAVRVPVASGPEGG